VSARLTSPRAQCWASRALDTILEQGEGARGHWEAAHFGEFVRILEEYRGMLAVNPAFEPVRPVVFAKGRRGEHDDAIPLIGDRVTRGCTDLFNVSYEILLQILERYFAHTEETDEQLATLANAAVIERGGRSGRHGCCHARCHVRCLGPSGTRPASPVALSPAPG
jgi:hypothetical protein